MSVTKRQSQILFDFKSAVGWDFASSSCGGRSTRRSPTDMRSSSSSQVAQSKSIRSSKTNTNTEYSSSGVAGSGAGSVSAMGIAELMAGDSLSALDTSSELSLSSSSIRDDLSPIYHHRKQIHHLSDGGAAGAADADQVASVTVCRHYLKGRCRHKKRCKFSHDIKSCPYCSSALPDSDPARTSHLTKCWKTHQEMADGTSSD